MATFSQANRPLRVDTTLGEDVLLLERLSASEGVSQPFDCNLDLLSTDQGIDGKALLRTPMRVTVKLVDGSERYFHGLVRRFATLGRSEDLAFYRAEVVPWLWFLSLSSDCKIFQKKTVPEIFEEVFTSQGYSDFEFKLVKRITNG